MLVNFESPSVSDGSTLSEGFIRHPGTDYQFGTPHGMDITFKFNNEVAGMEAGFLGGNKPNVLVHHTTLQNYGQALQKQVSLQLKKDQHGRPLI